ncbi:tyrosine-protein phosphatase non-receptor type 4 [Planococcus citri]|uniref:tyrosine-protein phosphatase non-receptor type 4 n=1 Tax=Planococcus citri TaxID=170843 RepID=UPI0031FA1C70
MLESVSRRTFGGSSGTYNVRASELARDRGRLKTLNVTVVFLDDTQHSFQLDKHAKGNVLLECVFQHLELIEKDYFGLQFTENGSAPSLSNTHLTKWLDPNKAVKKQARGGCFYFKVKFYVTDPSKLQEEYTRYHFYLQVRKDILQGKLLVSPSTACLLASYTVQSELGDYQIEELEPNYLSGMVLVPGQTEEMERKISELHKMHKGQTPADAEFNFLDHVKRLETYGVDLHRARDSSNKELQLGVTANGLVVFQNNIRINTISWAKIVKISFKRKQFFVQIRREPSENYDTLLGFNMLTYRSSKNLWKSCVEHHTFFRLDSPHVIRKLIPTALRLGSKFRYSGRTEFQTLEESRQGRSQRHFFRTTSKVGTRHSVMPTIEEKTKSLISSGLNTRAQEKVIGNWENSRQTWGETSSPHPSDDEGGFLDRQNGTSEETKIAAFSPILPSRTVISYVDDDTTDSLTERSHHAPGSLYDIPNYETPVPQVEENIVCIKLTPDDQGRFGFNVKGGSDLNMPILVSRVAPNTPADRCYPKLNEGDQVLMINGCSISGLEHDQVVKLIRAARDAQPRTELTLTVKQNVMYEPGGQEEPPYQYVPESPLSEMQRGAGALEQSMLLLADGLASGALVAQFEQLYRKKPGMNCNESKKSENINKNRYRDISPYDATRVVLKNGQDGDYINANYVNMEIPGSGIINRYIATQGPLQNTINDFWQMTLEAQSTLIVMVTTLMERGRSKCAKYWPSVSEILELGPTLRLKTTKEESDPTSSFVFREFVLWDTKSGESREITQMQYLAWPDHGVPDDISRFLTFTEHVRRARAGMVEPTIVHCSAGIGRTGVLILMETAMCLIEANEPVYPLDIVRQMRDQRVMMIQTPSQYRFVCSCVHYAYTEGLVKPLAEFLR